MSKEQIFQLQSMSTAKMLVNQRFVVKNSDVYCLKLIFDLSKLKMKSSTQNQTAQASDD